ncbi:hypothetical protein PILCRDRAFT_458288 [Piloderma croceum F 1598]|uniref:Uncharacterized protein n=1 Tax=Piloderma croceum (strain F 1598) TaxID=765440 RepID=A0A0C3BZP7_PILCF|nr:hypothetical protein PILCRDRAFT_458288 [Piloderma croceum F 1598]
MLSETAETEALTILQLMIAQNLSNTTGAPCTPFSMLDIQQYIEFFDFSKKLEERQGGMPVSKAIIITNIMANFYTFRSLNSKSEQKTRIERMSLLKIIITVACWGMPPNYLQRFEAACNEYQRTLQSGSWASFLDLVRKERAAANVVVSNPFFEFDITMPSTTHR